MFEQLLGALLFLFGFQTGGSIRGESTPSAVASTSATTATTSVKSFTPNNIVFLQAKFEEKHKQAVTAMEAKRASFSATLLIMKDEKKRAVVESIQNQIAKINENQTALLMGRLKRLNVGVEEMQNLAEKYEQDSGKDLSSVATSLSAANTAVADAISAVTTQTGKTYSIAITSETKAKDDVGKVHKQLAADLKIVRDTVAQARKKVGEALKSLKSAIGKPVLITIQSTAETPTMSITATPMLLKTQ